MDMQRAIIDGLVARGLPLHVAQGAAANMRAESGFNPGINEIAPLVPGSRGGYGLNQWTGPRRNAFEEYVQSREVSPSDLDAQLDFTMQELQGPEIAAFRALQATDNPIDAARVYSERFLRPGIPHMDKRLQYASEIAGMPIPEAGPSAPEASTGGNSDLLALIDQRSRPREAQQREPSRAEQLSEHMATMNALSQFMPQAQTQDVRNYLTQPQQPQQSVGFGPGTNPFLVG